MPIRISHLGKAVVCSHRSRCPVASRTGQTVRSMAWRPEQGWRRLCRDIPCSEGTGEALADVWIVTPHRVLFASRSV
ncbi:DUF5999 family protein [Streptomyces sp. TE3672]